MLCKQPLIASFVNEKEVEESEFIVHPPLIAKYQSRDKYFQKQMVKTGGKGYTSKLEEGVELVHYKIIYIYTWRSTGSCVSLVP